MIAERRSILQQKLKRYILLVFIAGLIIVADRITKNLVTSQLALGEMWSPWEWLTPYARIVHWYNTGVAFGLFQDQNLFFKVLSSIVAVGILAYYPRIVEQEVLLRIALSMQFGGAVGNLIDRFTIGHVTDFVSIGNFPVWNVADASITIGVGLMILGLWLDDKKSVVESSNPLKKIVE